MADAGGSAEIVSSPGQGTDGRGEVAGMIPVAIIDDHPLYRRGVSQAVQQRK